MNRGSVPRWPWAYWLSDTVISRFGLIDLIARGYGTLTIGFIVVYVIPVLTLGVWKLRRT